MVTVRNAAAEASSILGDGTAGRVLEPSPPAIDDGQFYADDPVNAPVDAARVVSFIGGDRTWHDEVAERPDLEGWAAERWLAGSRRLPPLPEGLVAARTDLHRLATYVVAPARHRANGKFGLRWTLGGFGTPFFGDDVQIRVAGDELIVQEGDSVRSTPITTLAAAAAFIGGEIDPKTAAEHDSPPVGDVDTDLGVSAAVTDFLGSWWGLGTAALEQLRADEHSVDPSRVQLWPGHFDPAIEAGDEDRRASYGASPGDATSDEPYLYVSVWWPDRLSLDTADSYWNADGFVGARLSYADLVTADDQVAAAVEFYRAGRDRLRAG